MSRAGYRAPVVEYCGGTEIGGGYITGTVVQPASPATFTTPALGLDLVLLDEVGRGGRRGRGRRGVPGAALDRSLRSRLLNATTTRSTTRLPGRSAGRAAAPPRRPDRAPPGGFFRARGRADDTMNLGGIKVDPLEIERVVGLHPVVGESPPWRWRRGGRRRPAGAVRGAPPADRREELKPELQRLVGDHLNPLFRIHDLVEVEQLPRTASNKLLRRELRARRGPEPT